MKKLLFIILLAATLPTSSCKKEYCWVCTSTVTGNDEDICSMTKKDAERKEGQGYTCRKK
jgi:hypothetical protein